jgi:hypothetical protein
MARMKVDPSKKWAGPTRPYDIIKEGTIALAIVAILVTALSIIFSSPDDPAVTLKSWSAAAPADFAQVAAGELAGTTTSAGYGAPYNTNGQGQHLGPIKLIDWIGVHIPIDPAKDFVETPLAMSNDAAGKSAVATYVAASSDQQGKWASAYADALTKDGKSTQLADPAGKYGPVPAMVSSLLGMAQSGALDGALTTSDTNLPTNFTKPLLFLADSDGYFGTLASDQHLGGDQWGVMNETGSWPGQSWLWLFSFWYQIDPFKSSANADIIIMSMMALLTVGLALFPILPVIKRIPMWIPIHRLIWKDWYKQNI